MQTVCSPTKTSLTVLLTPCCLRWQFPPIDEDAVLAACKSEVATVKKKLAETEKYARNHH